MALEVDIRKKCGDFFLDAAFSTESGVFALLGASGCGKSLTLKCIAGIEKPDEGRIVLGGRVLFDSAGHINLTPQKRKVGYMFQDYALFPNMTVRENIMAGMGKKPDPSVVQSYLTRFHMEECGELYPKQLSGGQKQRVAMARMLAAGPEVILLDEPFAALDSYLRWQLEMEMKKTLEEAKKPAVFVSHSRDEVYHLCSTVCCMEKGKTGETMPLSEFFNSPGTKTAALLSGCKNISRCLVIDEHHLKAEEWGTVFNVRRPVPPDTAYVGIRAHYIRAFRDETCDNELIPESTAYNEDPFERTAFLKMAGGRTALQRKTAKEKGTVPEKTDRYYIDSDDIMLLRD